MTAVVRNLGCGFTREPDKTAIIDLRVPDQPRRVSYADFDAECDAVARGLLRRGLKRGDKVGILSLNRTELLAVFFGTMRAGMVTVPISIRLPRDTIDYIIRDSGAAFRRWRQALTVVDELDQPDAGELRARLASLSTAQGTR